ncbi:hypothetical protein IMZ48_17235, partial [Candidatus Bathyarchaeota archaeon]|nr:hypothetical protein [Candidatus Bathyarchaeota archaeon]
VGARPTWKRLLAGESGVASLLEHRGPRSRWEGIPSTVAGLVPGEEAENGWRAGEWLGAGECGRMPRHTQFAVAAGDMALEDAGWESGMAENGERAGVSMGSGIGDLEQLFETSLAFERGVGSVPRNENYPLPPLFSHTHNTVEPWLRKKTGLQKDTTALRPADPPEHGSRPHLNAPLPPRTKPLPNNSLRNGRRLHRRRLHLHPHGPRGRHARRRHGVLRAPPRAGGLRAAALAFHRAERRSEGELSAL